MTAEAMTERQREKEVGKRRLRELADRSSVVRGFIDHNVASINGTPGESKSFDRLDALLSEQAYRLCHWKAAQR